MNKQLSLDTFKYNVTLLDMGECWTKVLFFPSFRSVKLVDQSTAYKQKRETPNWATQRNTFLEKLSVTCIHYHLKKLAVSQSVRNVLSFYVIHIFITVFIVPKWISS